MIDRPHLDHVFDIRDGTFDLRELLVELHGCDGGEVFLLGLDNVFALVRLLSGEVEGMLEKSEDTVFKAPIEIAMAEIAGEDGSGCCANLLGRLEPAFGDTFFECRKFYAYTLHRLGALSVLECQALFGMHDEHAHAVLVGGNLLHQCRWR
jgi:hypothetical protein